MRRTVPQAASPPSTDAIGCRATRGKGRSKEERIVAGAAAHVGKGKPRTGVHPPVDLDLFGLVEPGGRRPAGGPRQHDLPQAKLERGTRVVGHTSMPLARI